MPSQAWITTFHRFSTQSLPQCCAQGSYLLAHPEAYDAMFWKSLPNGTFWPMFVVATMAAIIASQALISAVFQIVSQAIVQGFFPRFHVYHTSREVCLSALF